MAEIRNSDDFENWLENKPAVYAQALAARIAMRILPLFPLQDSPDLALSIWRANFISWSVRSYPLHEMIDAAISASHAIGDGNVIKGAEAVAVAEAAELAASAAANGGSAVFYALDTISAIRHIGDIDNTYSAIHADADYLEQMTAVAPPRDNASSLMVRPLWLVSAPASLKDAWQERRSEFRRLGFDWEIWVDWYEQRIEGRNIAFSRLPIPYDDITASIAMESEAFWDRPPAEVNAEINASLHLAELSLDQTNKPLPGYYRIEIENDRLTAKPVAPEMARKGFAQGLLEALRDLVTDTLEAIENVQDDAFLSRQLVRLATALEPDLDNLSMARLSALHSVLSAQASAHDDPLRESHSTVRGALNGLNEVLENLLAHSEAVREAFSSQVALKITTNNLSELEGSVNQVADIVAQSNSADQFVIDALNEGRVETAEMDILSSPMSVSPAELQKILRRRADLNGQRLVTIWNVIVSLQRATTDNVSTIDLYLLLVALNAPVGAIAIAVPSFIALKTFMDKLPDRKQGRMS